MNIKKRLKKISGSWYFFLLIVFVYLGLFIFRQHLFFSSIRFCYTILIKIIPVFILVFLLMSLTNYYISPKFLMKHLGARGMKKWFFIILGGIISTGPVYMWYPLLADLKKKGLRYGLIACFLYNRAIKIPLLPIAIIYFGWLYVCILSFVMIGVSVIQGLVINTLMEEAK